MMTSLYRKDVLDGMNIHSINKKKLIDFLKFDIDNKIIQQYISITNTEAMSIGLANSTHLDYINDAKFSLCDGIGIKIAAKFHGINIRRYHGPDVMIDIINEGQKYGWSHYFLGGKNGVGEELKETIKSNYPKAIVKGIYSPPFRDQTIFEEENMLKNINKAKPNFLWVSLGLPKQEKWINKHKSSLDVNFCIGIGAAFDFHTNNIKRAPILYQKYGMEWLYRVIREPRMIKRNISSFYFMISLILKRIKK